MIADRVTDNLSADAVSVDNEEAGAMGARHLIDLGHKDILIAASSLSLANIRQRCSGASQVLRSRGLPEPAIVELGFTIDEASARLSQWFDENPPPTAIQALTNFTTLSVLTTLAERGLRMPHDISLIGFDDYTWMRARATPLTAIFQPVREMGRALWDTLGARIKGDLSPPRHVLLPCELRVRKSSGPSTRCASRKPCNRGACRNERPQTTANPNEFWVAIRPRAAGSIDPQLARAANDGRSMRL